MHAYGVPEERIYKIGVLSPIELLGDKYLTGFGFVDFIIENKLGIYEPKVKPMRDKIKNLLKNDELMKFYKQKITNMNLRNGLHEVAELLIK